MLQFEFKNMLKQHYFKSDTLNHTIHRSHPLKIHIQPSSNSFPLPSTNRVSGNLKQHHACCQPHSSPEPLHDSRSKGEDPARTTFEIC